MKNALYWLLAHSLSLVLGLVIFVALFQTPLLAKYHLPVDIETDHRKVFEVLKLDKKRMDDQIHFVLLNKIGHAEAKPVRLDYLEAHIKELL